MATSLVGQTVLLNTWRKLVKRMPRVFPFLSVSQQVDLSRVKDREREELLAAVLQAVGRTLGELPWARVYYEGQDQEQVGRVEQAVAAFVVCLEDGLVQIPLPDDVGEWTVTDVANWLRDQRAALQTVDGAYLTEVETVVEELGGFGPRQELLERLDGRGRDLFSPLVSVVDTAPGELATLLLWPYQLAKIGVGPVRNVAVVAKDGSLVPRPTVMLSMVYDHRVLTQTGAAHLLARIKAHLEETSPPPALPEAAAVLKEPHHLGQQAYTQFSFQTEVAEVMELAHELEPLAAQAGDDKLAYWAILVKAVAVSALAQPEVVSRYQETGVEYLDRLTVGLLVDGPEGLRVWVVADPTEKSVEALITELGSGGHWCQRGQENELLASATLLINDIGPWDMDYNLPSLFSKGTINLTLGRVRKAVVCSDGELTSRLQFMLHGMIDRRLIDPYPLSKFIQVFQDVLSNAREKREVFWEQRPFERDRPEFVNELEFSGWRQLWMEWIPTVSQESVSCLIDMGEALELYRRAKPIVEGEGLRLTYTSILLQAVGRALADHPFLNAGYEDVGEGQVRLHPRIIAGFNVNAGDKGQPPYPVFDTEQKTLLEMASVVAEGTQRVRSMTLDYYKDLAAALRGMKQSNDVQAIALPEDVERWERLLQDPEVQVLSHNTVNVTNFGVFGVDICLMGYIDTMDTLTLSLHQIAEKPAWHQDALTARPRMWVTAFCDSRIVYHDHIVQFLTRLREILENASTTLPIQ